MQESPLRQRRKELNLTQHKVSQLTGIHPSHISEFENGRRAPWPKARLSLAIALNTTEAELFPEEMRNFRTI